MRNEQSATAAVLADLKVYGPWGHCPKTTPRKSALGTIPTPRVGAKR